jgi:signal transduction histidine kinase
MIDRANVPESTEQFLSGGGEMGKLIRSMDWSTTALGPIEHWPQSLRTSVGLCLSSTFPILIAWGPETIQIYNDSYRPICGAKHPESMGQNFRICWETALSVVGDAFTRGQQGEGTYIKDQRMFLDRYGYLEEAFMTFSFAPIRDESGNVGGIFHPITETTDKMLSARRTDALRELGSRISKAKSIEEIWEGTLQRYDDYNLDLPFLLLYQSNTDGTSAHLHGIAGLSAGTALTPAVIDLKNDDSSPWPLAEAARTRSVVKVDHLTRRFGTYACAPYDEPPQHALVLPIHISGQEEPFGYLVAGVSICRALDREYENFYELLVNTYNTAMSNVYAYEQEQKRAEALAAIDRSKTAFFSNVSHEFRTPLTLMLGPLEELMQHPVYNDPAYKRNIESAHGNALRLLRLVNNLLDFSRVEADRVKATYQPLDLATLTTDLASSFRSIIEKAGMELVVSCMPLREPVYADREMWEKIVLNLLSNAFKYTLAGSITVVLEDHQHEAILKITDTGIGIPAHELPHMFQRFHRVAQNLGRTHEGTGIGLSLVSELARLHGGTVGVESAEAAGSTFTVTIPFGKSHLAPALVSEHQRPIDTAVLQGAFLKEATMLLDDVADVQRPHASAARMQTDDPFADNATHILIAEDNNDMRDYLVRLLQPYYTLATARDGVVALEKLENRKPDLIISDIMMPVMDGKALLARVKGNPQTAAIPFIFLSARAGEEARIDGLEAGADAYLIKPFSAKDLLTTVRIQLRKSSARQHAEQQLRNLVIQAPVAIAIYKGPEHIVDIANDRMLRIWNKQADDVVNRPLFDAMPDLRGQGFEALMDTVYRDGKSIVTGETLVKIMRHGAPEDIYVTIAFEPLRDDDVVYGIMVIAADVTDLVDARTSARQIATKLEQKVAERTRELSESNHDLVRINRELEQYIYVASHDLQEPVRKIRVFTSLLERMPDLPEGAMPILLKVASSSERMTKLVQDLLALSRFREPLENMPVVDLNLVLAQVLTDFELIIAEKRATIDSDPLPSITSVSFHMTQLFSNLLSNALKFARKDTPPHIRIRLRMLNASAVAAATLRKPEGEYFEIAFQDNGIGFDNRFAGRIFEIFKRLHSRESYTGSGIGLAICSRIVQIHGGAITAESTEGVGTTVRIVLPITRP